MQRIIFPHENGRLSLLFDPERHSVITSQRKIVLRWDGVLEVYRLKEVEVVKEGEKVCTNYIAGECLLCLKPYQEEVES